MSETENGPSNGNAEIVRQTVHLGSGSLALLLHWLSRWEGAGLAGLAVVFNFFILPRIGWQKKLARPSEAWLSGIKVYPISVLILVLCFPLPVAAGAWVVMAVGDSVSTWLGKRWGRRKLPWNGKKSYLGTFSFVLAAIPAAFVTMLWVYSGNPSGLDLTDFDLVSLAAVGTVVAALFESFPFPIDDNWTVPLSAALAMSLLLALL